MSAHVLVLEDDEGLLALAARVLKKHGHRVTGVSDVEAAEAAVARELPDLLIVDYNLQALESGLDFFRGLRARGIGIPAIMVSGVSDEPRIIEALRAGVSDVLPKTSDYLDYLPEAVERLLSQLQLQRQSDESARLLAQEQYYRMVAEAIPHLVWSCDPAGQFDYLSKQWLDYTGIGAELQLGMRWLELVVHPQDRDSTRERLLQAVRESHERFVIEFRLRRADGQYRWFTCDGAPLLCAAGEVRKWLGTCTDIDDLKRAQHERETLLAAERLARADAERMTRMKDEFVATLSHELRTPLNAIVGWTQYLLRDHADPARLDKGLHVIERNAKLQAQMVEDLLDMSRILSGKLRLDVVRVDLVEVIDNAIASVQTAADAKEIALSTVLGAPSWVQGDPSRLQQVVWNLLMNAIKFTPRQGKVDIMVSQDAASGEVELRVSDTGQGIKPEFLASVFDRFRQEDASTSRPVNGLGLGLSITRQLVELHGGSVRARSEGPGRGASFYVNLPLAASQREEGATQLRSIAPEVEPELSGLRVLLVEDEPDARELVQRILEERGATVDAVGSADEALQMFRAARPNVIVSDIGLPGQDGYELMRSVRELESHQHGMPLTPAAALTALARAEDRRRALMAGFQAHIAKPVDPLELLFLIASLSGRTGARLAH